jgi:two-component system sensor histidine kinase VanS
MKGNTRQGMNRKPPVFTKIFAYTMLLLVLMMIAAVAIFAQQFLLFYRAEHRRQLAGVFQPMFRQFEGKTPEEVTEIARAFYDKNQSFRFIVKKGSGDVLFSSPEAEENGNYQLLLHVTRGTAEADAATVPEPVWAENAVPGSIELREIRADTLKLSEDAYTLLGSPMGSDPVDYGVLAGKSFLALLIMIAIGVLGAVLFTRKITKPLEDELVRERVMEENQRLFFSAASHELKTPIAAARALIEGMIANIGDYRDHPKYLRECLKNLDSQNHLVSEILELVKLPDETTEPAIMPLDVAEIGDSLIAEYRPLGEQRGVKIVSAFPAALVRADRNLLRRVLSNVLANAVQNTPENETIHIGAEKRGERHIRLSVLNTGAHIPDELLPRLFDPFYRLDPARGRNRGGSGLGLTIVKKSLDFMGIPFALENSGEGVLFWMDLEAEYCQNH